MALQLLNHGFGLDIGHVGFAAVEDRIMHGNSHCDRCKENLGDVPDVNKISILSIFLYMSLQLPSCPFSIDRSAACFHPGDRR